MLIKLEDAVNIAFNQIPVYDNLNLVIVEKLKSLPTYPEPISEIEKMIEELKAKDNLLMNNVIQPQLSAIKELRNRLYPKQ